MVPGRNRGGGLVEVLWPVLLFWIVLFVPDPGESTQGEDWLMMMAGLPVALVWVELEFSVAAGGKVASGAVNSVVGLLAELLVLWKGREPGLRGIVPINPVCTPVSWVCVLFSQHPP